MKKTLLLLALLASSAVFAETDTSHCTVAVPQEDMTPFAHEVVGKPVVLDDKRLYTLKNNDLFITFTDNCGLGREGMLLLSNPFYSDEEKRQKAQWILRVFYGDDNTLLDNVLSLKPQGEVYFAGNGEEEKHLFTFSRLSSADYAVSLFSESVHYTWVAPMGVE